MRQELSIQVLVLILGLVFQMQGIAGSFIMQLRLQIPSIDYYRLLDLEEHAVEEEIKKAYRKAALKWHPDKNLGNEHVARETFKQISEAVDILTNSE